jgi:hypothetical protein
MAGKRLVSDIGAMIAEGRSICGACARARGATWPEGHVATMWVGVCGACNEQKAVCCVTDWHWPRYPEADRAREL